MIGGYARPSSWLQVEVRTSQGCPLRVFRWMFLKGGLARPGKRRAPSRSISHRLTEDSSRAWLGSISTWLYSAGYSPSPRRSRMPAGAE